MYLVPFLRYSALKNGVTLKPGGSSSSRSLKIAPFDRSYSIRLFIGPPKIYGSAGSAIVNIALSCTVFDLFDVELYRHLTNIFQLEKLENNTLNMRITWPQLKCPWRRLLIFDIAASLLLTWRRKVRTTVFRRQNSIFRKQFLEIGLHSSVAVLH